MAIQRKDTAKTSWFYKLWVLIQIPPLFIYYTILKPIGFYFKDLIAEQSSNIKYEKTQRVNSQTSHIKKAFVVQSVIIISKTIIRYLIHYWWVAAILVVIWLIINIGLLPAIESLGGWIFLWIIYKVLKGLIKGIYQ